MWSCGLWCKRGAAQEQRCEAHGVAESRGGSQHKQQQDANVRGATTRTNERSFVSTGTAPGPGADNTQFVASNEPAPVCGLPLSTPTQPPRPAPPAHACPEAPEHQPDLRRAPARSSRSSSRPGESSVALSLPQTPASVSASGLHHRGSDPDTTSGRRSLEAQTPSAKHHSSSNARFAGRLSNDSGAPPTNASTPQARSEGPPPYTWRPLAPCTATRPTLLQVLPQALARVLPSSRSGSKPRAYPRSLDDASQPSPTCAAPSATPPSGQQTESCVRPHTIGARAAAGGRMLLSKLPRLPQLPMPGAAGPAVDSAVTACVPTDSGAFACMASPFVTPPDGSSIPASTPPYDDAMGLVVLAGSKDEGLLAPTADMDACGPGAPPGLQLTDSGGICILPTNLLAARGSGGNNNNNNGVASPVLNLQRTASTSYSTRMADVTVQGIVRSLVDQETGFSIELMHQGAAATGRVPSRAATEGEPRATSSGWRGFPSGAAPSALAVAMVWTPADTLAPPALPLPAPNAGGAATVVRLRPEQQTNPSEVLVRLLDDEEQLATPLEGSSLFHHNSIPRDADPDGTCVEPGAGGTHGPDPDRDRVGGSGSPSPHAQAGAAGHKVATTLASALVGIVTGLSEHPSLAGESHTNPLPSRQLQACSLDSLPVGVVMSTGLGLGPFSRCSGGSGCSGVQPLLPNSANQQHRDLHNQHRHAMHASAWAAGAPHGGALHSGSTMASLASSFVHQLLYGALASGEVSFGLAATTSMGPDSVAGGLGSSRNSRTQYHAAGMPQYAVYTPAYPSQYRSRRRSRASSAAAALLADTEAVTLAGLDPGSLLRRRPSWLRGGPSLGVFVAANNGGGGGGGGGGGTSGPSAGSGGPRKVSSTSSTHPPAALLVRSAGCLSPEMTYAYAAALRSTSSRRYVGSGLANARATSGAGSDPCERMPQRVRRALLSTGSVPAPAASAQLQLPAPAPAMPGDWPQLGAAPMVEPAAGQHSLVTSLGSSGR